MSAGGWSKMWKWQPLCVTEAPSVMCVPLQLPFTLFGPHLVDHPARKWAWHQHNASSAPLVAVFMQKGRAYITKAQWSFCHLSSCLSSLSSCLCFCVWCVLVDKAAMFWVTDLGYVLFLLKTHTILLIFSMFRRSTLIYIPQYSVISSRNALKSMQLKSD